MRYSETIAVAWDTVDRLLGDGLEEMCALHYEEVAVDKSDIPLAPDWDEYRFLEKRGKLPWLSVRRQGRLIGYASYFIGFGLHYKLTKSGQNDLMFIERGERRKGAPGLRMLVEAEHLMRALGVVRLIYHTKLHVVSDHGTKVGALMERLGYCHFEDCYSKILRG